MDKLNEGAQTSDEDAELDGYVLRRSSRMTRSCSPKLTHSDRLT